MEVGPGDGERILDINRTEPRKQKVEGEDEDVPFCVSKLCVGLFVLATDYKPPILQSPPR